MVEQGARRLILLGRTPLPARSEWKQVEAGTPLARRISGIREIESLGASVHPVAVDVADEGQLRSFLESFDEEGWPPIRGVVHAAGVASLQTTVELDPVRLRSTLRPKVHGAWQLHRAFEDADLDFFVLFSSATSLLSSPRVAHYAAANAFLDGLAHFRRAQGLPAISINWGLWGEVGMAARHLDQGHSLLQGIDTFSPEQGFEVLGRLLGENCAQAAVIRVDWQECGRRYPVLLQSPFISDLAREKTLVSVAPRYKASGALTRRMLLDAESEERQRMLMQGLRERVGSALDLAPEKVDAQAELTCLGFDSLMAMDLKNFVESDLGVHVHVESLLGESSLSHLAQQILDQLSEDPCPEDNYIIPAVRPRHDEEHGVMDVGELEQALENLDRFSDDEVEVLLKSMLRADPASQ
jgi:acyl carrier protein